MLALRMRRFRALRGTLLVTLNLNLSAATFVMLLNTQNKGAHDLPSESDC